ncbi:MAG TPA: hypothetical protein VJ623_11255 [Holophagaceae bacterium]|nr:hypothetical protein [Holophagaceae bacterium]
MFPAFIAPPQVASPNDLAGFKAEAFKLAREGRWAELKALCVARRTLTFGDPPTVVFMAWAELGLGHPQEALTRLAPLLASDTPFPLAWWVAGLSHLDLGPSSWR